MDKVKIYADNPAIMEVEDYRSNKPKPMKCFYCARRPCICKKEIN